MDYRVVEFARNAAGRMVVTKTLATFESAYTALEHMRSARNRREEGSGRWHMVDGEGVVLLRPDDFAHNDEASP